MKAGITSFDGVQQGRHLAVENNRGLEMEKIVTWTTGDGKVVEFKAEIITSRPIYLDRPDVTVACCEIERSARFDGQPISDLVDRLTTPIACANGKVVVGTLGSGREKIGLVKETMDQIMAAIAEVKAAHAEMTGAAKIKAENEMMESGRRPVCPKCGSHCHGDCQAN